MIRCVFGCCYIMVFAGNEIDVYIIFIYKWVRSAEWGLRSKDKDGYTHTYIRLSNYTSMCTYVCFWNPIFLLLSLCTLRKSLSGGQFCREMLLKGFTPHSSPENARTQNPEGRWPRMYENSQASPTNPSTEPLGFPGQGPTLSFRIPSPSPHTQKNMY